MHCVCFNVVCTAEKWTLTVVVVVLPVILALWYRQADQFTSTLAYIMSSRPVWAMWDPLLKKEVDTINRQKQAAFLSSKTFSKSVVFQGNLDTKIL